MCAKTVQGDYLMRGDSDKPNELMQTPTIAALLFNEGDLGETSPAEERKTNQHPLHFNVLIKAHIERQTFVIVLWYSIVHPVLEDPRKDFIIRHRSISHMGLGTFWLLNWWTVGTPFVILGTLFRIGQGRARH